MLALESWRFFLDGVSAAIGYVDGSHPDFITLCLLGVLVWEREVRPFIPRRLLYKWWCGRCGCMVWQTSGHAAFWTCSLPCNISTIGHRWNHSVEHFQGFWGTLGPVSVAGAAFLGSEGPVSVKQTFPVNLWRRTQLSELQASRKRPSHTRVATSNTLRTHYVFRGRVQRPPCIFERRVRQTP